MPRVFIRLAAAAALILAALAAPAFASNPQAWDQAMQAYRTGDMVTARQQFSRACTGADNERACMNAGVMHRDGMGGETDLIHARWLFNRGCDLGHAGACYNLGHMAMNGQGREGDADPRPDDEIARTALEAACSADIIAGCNGLGILLETGRGGGSDPVRARGLYQQACEGGSVDACINYATVLDRGIGGAADTVRARALLTSSCTGGEDQACEALEELNAGTLGLADVVASPESLRLGIEAFNAENWSEALRQLLPNAGAGDMTAQYLVGYINTFGLGKPRDYLAAGDWLTRAAEQGDERAQDLIVRIAENIAQARYIDHIDRFGPDTSSLSAFSTDVAIYCTLRGSRCTEFRGQENRWRNAHNRAAEAANLRRIWNNYGMGESAAQSIAQSRARSECLREVARSTEAQMRGRQDWRYINTC